MNILKAASKEDEAKMLAEAADPFSELDFVISYQIINKIKIIK